VIIQAFYLDKIISRFFLSFYQIGLSRIKKNIYGSNLFFPKMKIYVLSFNENQTIVFTTHQSGNSVDKKK